MKTKDVIEHFGSVRDVAEILRITVQSIYEWGDEPPIGRQYQIQVMTKGRLKVSQPEAKQA